MFARRPDALPSVVVTISVDGAAVDASEGDTVAVALLTAGIVSFRTTPVGGVPRGPYCLMGACFECLVEVDGRPNRRACMTRVAPGMRIVRPKGAPDIAGGSEAAK